ncbi:hypothetical protein MMC07_000907 [Pseudocyphellaria aurata]|nr:hypothetical protein [Pseudocyphellaria aurata]
MRIDWNNKDSFKRLLAAMVAAQDMKLNYSKIAMMYGQGATYDAIEGHFRKIKKDAVQLREEQDIRVAGAPSSPTPTPKKPRKKEKAETTPAVLGGRVKKSSASKRKKAIKVEMVDGEEDGDAEGETDVEAEAAIVESQIGLSAPVSYDTDVDLWQSNPDHYYHSFDI